MAVYDRNTEGTEEPTVVHERAHFHLNENRATLTSHDFEMSMTMDAPTISLGGPSHADGSYGLFVAGWAHTPGDTHAEYQNWHVDLPRS